MGLFKKAYKLAWGTTKLSAKVAVKTPGVVIKTTCVTAKATGISAKVTTKASYATAKTLYTHRKKIAEATVGTIKCAAGATVGTTKGVANAINDASGYLASDESFNAHIRTVEKQSHRYRQLAGQFNERLSNRRHRKGALLDTLVVGGETVASYMRSGQVPDDIQKAYERAYPHVAATRSFGDQIDRLDDKELMGFVSGIKGKLFEIQYIDSLNAGGLPDGFSAELASSPTNPGWDIAILGPNSEIQDTIQAKATQSVSYVTEALVENPHIDVVTTSEVHSQLIMQGFSENVIDSGISDSDLTTAIDDSISDTSTSMDFMPSPVSLALIAFSSYSQEGLTAYEQSSQFGERSLKSYLAYIAGGSLAVLTGTWWVGMIGGMGSRLMLNEGHHKLERLSQMEKSVRTNEKVINRLEKQLAKLPD